MENEERYVEEMREQLNALKLKVEKEAVINRQMIRNATRMRISVIYRRAVIQFLCALYTMIVTPSVFYHGMGLSIWFCVGTELLMLISALGILYVHRNVRNRVFAESDMITVARHMKRLKDSYGAWLKYGSLGAAFWVVWLFVELYAVCDGDAIISVAFPLVVGGVVGWAIGYRMHRKVVSMCDEIILDAGME